MGKLSSCDSLLETSNIDVRYRFDSFQFPRSFFSPEPPPTVVKTGAQNMTDILYKDDILSIRPPFRQLLTTLSVHCGEEKLKVHRCVSSCMVKLSSSICMMTIGKFSRYHRRRPVLIFISNSKAKSMNEFSGKSGSQNEYVSYVIPLFLFIDSKSDEGVEIKLEQLVKISDKQPSKAFDWITLTIWSGACVCVCVCVCGCRKRMLVCFPRSPRAAL